jgi:hypothetical protein
METVKKPKVRAKDCVLPSPQDILNVTRCDSKIGS